ncbi:hypothetical protein WMY93_029791 [Mugilogobius chulae]|uniref:Uncharacterized protein n=1 Tax=Mugilogobius chulae TaxID=88201 RepID=A0AAW0MVZ5_9GOBI
MAQTPKRTVTSTPTSTKVYYTGLSVSLFSTVKKSCFYNRDLTPKLLFQAASQTRAAVILCTRRLNWRKQTPSE